VRAARPRLERLGPVYARVAIGAAFLLFLKPGTTLILAGIGPALMGYGMGLLNITSVIMVQGTIEWSKRGSATAALIFSRSLGNTLGVAVLDFNKDGWMDLAFTHDGEPGVSLWSEFLRLTVVAYALALLVSLYVLWTFGRADGLPFGELLIETVVLGFPAALGAASARLIL